MQKKLIRCGYTDKEHKKWRQNDRFPNSTLYFFTHQKFINFTKNLFRENSVKFDLRNDSFSSQNNRKE